MEGGGAAPLEGKEKKRHREGEIEVMLNVKSILKYYFSFLIFLLKSILVNVLLVWGGRRSHGGAGRSCPLSIITK